MPAKQHALEREFQLSASTILTVIGKNNRCLIAVRGAVAQEHLRRYLRNLMKRGQIRCFDSIDADGKPDFSVGYRGREYLVECKNVQKTKRKSGITVDFMRSRYSKTQPARTRFYKPSEFHVLAACLYNQTRAWRFKFIPTARLRRHPRYKSRLDNKVSLAKATRYYKYWCDELSAALELVPRHA